MTEPEYPRYPRLSSDTSQPQPVSGSETSLQARSWNRKRWAIGTGVAIAAVSAGSFVFNGLSFRSKSGPGKGGQDSSLRHDPDRLYLPKTTLAQHKQILKETLAQENGPAARLVNTCVLAADWVLFLERNPDVPVYDCSLGINKYYMHASSAVRSGYEKGLLSTEGTPGIVTKLSCLKLKGFDGFLGDLPYNRASNLIFEALTTGPAGSGRLQCDSGSRLFTCLARDILGDSLIQSDGIGLVYIYTPGHVMPGLMVGKSFLVGYETTVKGGAVNFSSNLTLRSVPMRVTDAIYDDTANLLGEDAVKGKPLVLFDCVPEGTKSGALDGVRPNNRSTFAFGSCEVPSGDRIRSSQSSLSSSNYTGRQSVYSTLEGSDIGGGTARGDGRGTGDGGLSREVRYSREQALNKLNARERQIVKHYWDLSEQCMPRYQKDFDEGIRVTFDDSLKSAEKVRRLTLLIDKMDPQLKEDGLDPMWKEVSDILKNNGIELPWNDKTPIGSFNLLVNNLNVELHKQARQN